MLPDPGKILFWLKLAAFLVVGLMAVRFAYRPLTTPRPSPTLPVLTLTHADGSTGKVVSVTLRRFSPTNVPAATNDSVPR